MKITTSNHVTTLSRKALVAALLISISFVASNTSAASESTTAPAVAVGYLDTISVTGDEFSAQGWVASTNPAQKIMALVIQVGDVTIYEGRFERFERPDVAEAMARNDWVNSGWRVRSAIPSSLKAGKHAVATYAKMDSGEVIELPINKQASMIVIYDSNDHTRIMVMLGLLGCILLTIAAFHYAEEAATKLAQQLRRNIHPSVIPTLALTFVFACLVVMGTTGSSLKLGVEQSPFVRSDVFGIWGHPQPIRSDEWLVFSPLAIAQANHAPSFPVINKNIGDDGQNMLIVGMAGAPVAHISAFSKPATWGFHLFDLKHALSWYWWFPIFGGLFSLWAVFSLISPNHWRIGFLVSLIFCSSPYVTAWSYWPAYAALFPSLMLYSSVSILRTSNNVARIGWAIMLGLSSAGFVLLLYPPWQVSLGYLFLFLGVGIVLRDKLHSNFNLFRLFSFSLSLGLAIVILWNWWLDAEPAIITMMNTIYPGHRTSETGGSLTVTGLLRGFTNIITLYRMDGSYSNQSEIASFYYMFPSLLVLFGVRLWEKKIGYTHWLLLLFLTFTATFMLVGIPKEFATLSLWERVPVKRADLALGLAYILLVGALLVPTTARSYVYKIPVRCFAAIASLMWSLVVVYAISKMPHESLSGFSPGISLAIFLFILFGSWWLAIGEYRKFLVLNLAFSFATVLPFNPMTVAPNTVTPVADFAEDRSRVLVANTQIPAMFLLASGKPVSNGIFYYPQKMMWNRLDPDGSQANIYNRYQHLIFSLGSVPTPYYRIESPQADVVRVMVDTAHFDFRKTGAGVLVAPSNELNALKLNPSLAFVSESDGWSRFVVLKLEDK